MAERRMFAKTVVDSDAFLDLPVSSQALYFHIGVRADDDGFVNNPKKIARITSCTDEDLQKLVDNGFLISFNSGVVVVTHWRMNNQIRGNRYKGTVCVNEKEQLFIQSNGVYTLNSEQGARLVDLVANLATKRQPNDNQMATKRQLNGNQKETQCSSSVVKDSKVKDSLDKVIVVKDTPSNTAIYDDEHTKAIILYEDNIEKPLTPMMEEAIKKIVDSCGIEAFEKAVNKAVAGGQAKRNLAYITAVADGIAKGREYNYKSNEMPF